MFNIDCCGTEFVDIPYPKAGYPNPTVTLHAYSLSTNTGVDFSFNPKWEYIFTVQWGSNVSQIFVQLLNRYI